MKNWKTTVAGALVAVASFAVYMGWITLETSVALLGAFAALGFAVAKDNDQTGK